MRGSSASLQPVSVPRLDLAALSEKGNDKKSIGTNKFDKWVIINWRMEGVRIAGVFPVDEIQRCESARVLIGAHSHTAEIQLYTRSFSYCHDNKINVC